MSSYLMRLAWLDYNDSLNRLSNKFRGKARNVHLHNANRRIALIMSANKTGPCLSWRTRGGTWSVMEIGVGDAVKLSNHMRGIGSNELELSDKDLIEIRDLIDAAIKHRSQADSSVSAFDGCGGSGGIGMD